MTSDVTKQGVGEKEKERPVQVATIKFTSVCCDQGKYKTPAPDPVEFH